jgi:hypothetical protein
MVWDCGIWGCLQTVNHHAERNYVSPKMLVNALS